MHFAISSVKGGPSAKVWKSKPATPASSGAYAVDEINAYIAIRDELLAEAEETGTRAKLDSVIIANDFVAGCLKSARAPYQAQSLAEEDAARERQRCRALSNRVA